MDLYFAPGTIAVASLIALNETGVDFTLKQVDMSKSEQQSPDYLRVNPKGRVPALVTQDGTLTETIALLVYIAGLNPVANLLPKGAFEQARLLEFNSFLATTVHVNHAHKMRGHRWASEQSSFDDMKAKVTENMTASFQMIEDQYFQGPWVMGDQYTIADIYLFAITRWLKGDGVEVAQFSKIADHFARMAERPAVRAALAV